MTGRSLNAGERAARAARRRFGLDATGPVGDIVVLCEQTAGIPVLLDRFETDTVAGVLLRSRGEGDFIAINADFHSVRQRFTLAHELGHVEMNHEGRVDLSRDVGGPTQDPQEVEANYFAAEFLAPRGALREWLENEGLMETAGAPETVARVALTFGVARSTACYRLELAGLITKARSKQLLGDLAEEVKRHVQRRSADRLMDTIEQTFRDKRYPRVPRATLSYARQALGEGLIDNDEYRSITGSDAPDLDLAGWLE